MSKVSSKTAQELLRQFEPLINSEARRLANRSRNSPWFGFEDFVAVGQIAAIEAYVSYNAETNVTLKTWGHRIIKWRMREAAQRVSDPLGVISALRVATKKFAAGQVTKEEYERSKAQAEYFSAYYNNPFWIDAPLRLDHDGDFVDSHEMLRDENQDVEAAVTEAQQYQSVSNAISKLGIREQMVLYADLQEYSGRALGQEIGISRQRVAYYRKVSRAALAKMLAEEPEVR